MLCGALRCACPPSLPKASLGGDSAHSVCAKGTPSGVLFLCALRTYKIDFASQNHKNRGRVPRFLYSEREKISEWEFSDVRVLRRQNTTCRKNVSFSTVQEGVPSPRRGHTCRAKRSFAGKFLTSGYNRWYNIRRVLHSIVHQRGGAE